MDFAELVTVSRKVSEASGRLEKVQLLSDLLRRLEPHEIPAAVGILSGQPRQGRIGVGWAALQAASEANAGPPTLFDAAHLEVDPPLTVSDLDASLQRLLATSGKGSSVRRATELASLFRRAGPSGRDFLIRLLTGELRQGALGGTMEEAIVRASGLEAPEVRRAVMLIGDLGTVASAALSGGQAALASFHLAMFRPLAPMLAQAAETLEEALERLEEAAFEYKLDGARVQIHREGRDVRVFSRLMNDVTAAVPEVVDVVSALPLDSVVLDAETIALKDDGTPHPFQITMKRFGRRLDIERVRGELPLTTFAFDLLHLDGEDWFGRPGRDRFAALRRVAPDMAVPQIITSEIAEAERFLDEALSRGHEGLMAKSLDSSYEAGSRGYSWLKIKPAHTLDLVVLAAEWGHGRRQGWLSNLHLGARNAEGGFTMLGKTFKGMTDEMLAWQTEHLQSIATRSDRHVVHVRPELVVEIAFGDVQESPRYEGGMALRFARVKRYREDKPVGEIDTVETVRAIMEGRRRRGTRSGASSP
ncbi:MAG TPA: ATP-dependent DNA ligase [Candidatus Eisenbacteria bacterium]|nr:ATP-dependent DNA ligase [Candidatus Eisenbacteria bacterium]